MIFELFSLVSCSSACDIELELTKENRSIYFSDTLLLNQTLCLIFNEKNGRIVLNDLNNIKSHACMQETHQITPLNVGCDNPYLHFHNTYGIVMFRAIEPLNRVTFNALIMEDKCDYTYVSSYAPYSANLVESGTTAQHCVLLLPSGSKKYTYAPKTIAEKLKYNNNTENGYETSTLPKALVFKGDDNISIINVESNQNSSIKFDKIYNEQYLLKLSNDNDDDNIQYEQLLKCKVTIADIPDPKELERLALEKSRRGSMLIGAISGGLGIVLTIAIFSLLGWSKKCKRHDKSTEIDPECPDNESIPPVPPPVCYLHTDQSENRRISIPAVVSAEEFVSTYVPNEPE